MNQRYLALLLALSLCNTIRSEVVFDNLEEPFDGGANLSTDDDLAGQPFFIGDGSAVETVTVRLQRFGSPGGMLNFEIWNDVESLPGDPVAPVGSIELANVNAGRFQDYTFDARISDLNPNETYYVVMSGTELDVDANNRVDWLATPSTNGTNGANGLHGFHLPTMQWYPFHEWPCCGPPFPVFFGMKVVTGSQCSSSGDFDCDGVLGVSDIDSLSLEIRKSEPDPLFDLNGDHRVDQNDRRYWIEQLAKTWIGDATLDGEFNSSDLTVVFQGGKFELDENASWAEGDWTGDARFDSSDLVEAFKDAGYERGPRPGLRAVPEPSTSLVTAIVALSVFAFRRRSMLKIRKTCYP